MRVRYMRIADADLRGIIRFGVENNLSDPVTFVLGLRARFDHLADIEHPGRKGRLHGTLEWVITGTPYIAVLRREGQTMKIYRVLHGAQQWP